MCQLMRRGKAVSSVKNKMVKHEKELLENGKTLNEGLTHEYALDF